MKIWLKEHKGQLLLNIGTIVVVAILLTINTVRASNNTHNQTDGYLPGVFSYQGFISDNQGVPLNGSYDVVFRLYNMPSGGTVLWEESRIGANQLPIREGQINVMLGNLVPISNTVWDNPELYLGIQFSGDSEMAPRTLLSAVPYAQQAYVSQSALTVPNGSIKSENLILDSGTKCLETHKIVNLTGSGYEYVPIEELSLEFTLNQPSTVLVSTSGLAVARTSASESGVILNIDEDFVIGSISQNNNWWFNVGGTKLIDLEAGDHTLFLSAYSSGVAEIVVHGLNYGKTCVNYLVLGAP